MTERGSARRDELAAALSAVRERIVAACTAAGRGPGEVRLIAITKTFPATDAALLADLGMLDLGENREQEATTKVAELRELRPDAAVRWHMVGRLQRNKARPVARWAAEIQSVDSDRLADALDRAVGNARAPGRPPPPARPASAPSRSTSSSRRPSTATRPAAAARWTGSASSRMR
jgi:uncharacterized pyridoxal phosphate-containing UPF0001 family protein